MTYLCYIFTCYISLSYDYLIEATRTHVMVKSDLINTSQ